MLYLRCKKNVVIYVRIIYLDIPPISYWTTHNALATLLSYLDIDFTIFRAGVIPQTSGFNPFMGMGNVKQEVKQEPGGRFPPTKRAKPLVIFVQFICCKDIKGATLLLLFDLNSNLPLLLILVVFSLSSSYS